MAQAASDSTIVEAFMDYSRMRRAKAELYAAQASGWPDEPLETYTIQPDRSFTTVQGQCRGHCLAPGGVSVNQRVGALPFPPDSNVDSYGTTTWASGVRYYPNGTTFRKR